MTNQMLKGSVRTTISFKHPYAGHVNVARALKAAGLEYEMPASQPDEVRILTHRDVPAEETEPKAAQAIASALRAMGVQVEIESSTPR